MLFDPTKMYSPNDPALRLIATSGTLAFWRHKGRGPAFHKIGVKIYYAGEDLNSWLAARRVEPTERRPVGAV